MVTRKSSWILVNLKQQVFQVRKIQRIIFKNVFILPDSQNYREEGREIFHWFMYSPNIINSQSLICPKELAPSPSCGRKNQKLGPFSTAFPVGNWTTNGAARTRTSSYRMLAPAGDTMQALKQNKF